MVQKNIVMLSIDDSTLTTELDRAGYRKVGVTIKPANSFSKAQKVLETEAVDIVVVNWDYSKIDALAICKHFKSQEQTKHIPVVLTSVQSNNQRVQLALDSKADLFVEQPMARAYFIEKLKGLLDQKTRTEDRVEHTGQATFMWKGKEIQCNIGDISQGGLLLATHDMTFDSGEVFEMEFSLPGYKKSLNVTGQVVRRITKKMGSEDLQIGFGVKFIKFGNDSQKRLEKFVMKSKNDDPKLAYYL
jgi:response regulator RpfG family c-di-GMP phosphodiesterase